MANGPVTIVESDWPQDEDGKHFPPGKRIPTKSLFPLRDAYAEQSTVAFRSNRDEDIAEMNRLHALFAASDELPMFHISLDIGTFGEPRNSHAVAAAEARPDLLERVYGWYRSELGWTFTAEA